MAAPEGFLRHLVPHPDRPVQGCAVIEAHTGGLLGDIYIECRSGEQRGDDQRELPCIITSPVAMFRLENEARRQYHTMAGIIRQ